MTDRSDEVLGNEVEYTCKAGILAVGQACGMLQESFHSSGFSGEGTFNSTSSLFCPRTIRLVIYLEQEVTFELKLRSVNPVATSPASVAYIN